MDSHAKFHAIYYEAPVGMAELGADFRLRSVNRAFARMLGVASESLNGVDIRSLVADGEKEFRLVPDTPAEHLLLHSGGDVVWVDVQVKLIPDLQGEEPVCLAVFQNVTARRQAEIQAREREARFRSLAGASPMGVMGAEAKLRDSEQKLMLAQSAARAGMYDVDLATGKPEWTPENYSLFGLAPGSEISHEIWKSMIAPEDRQRVAVARAAAVLNGGTLELEYRIVRPDGSRRWIATSAGVLHDEQRNAVRLVGLNFDITDRKMADMAVRESEQRIRRIADAMPQIVWTSRPDLSITYYNKRWYEYIGATPRESGQSDWRRVVHPADMGLCVQASEAALREGKPYEIECRLPGADGSYRWNLVRSVPLRNQTGEIYEWVGTGTDIDERKRWADELERGVQQRTAQLSRSLAEKEILLKEVQHRVKNNLQVICSLMGLQVECARQSSAAAEGISLLTEAQGRIHAMALIHQQLYQTANVLALDFAGYIEPLAEQLFDAYGVSPARIRLTCSAESVQLPLAQAVSSGLILNELLSNSLKHAFGEAASGEVRVSFGRAREAGRLRLLVADNGVGLPADFDIRAATSLGMQIVVAMSAQLFGDVHIGSGLGAAIAVEWPESAEHRA